MALMKLLCPDSPYVWNSNGVSQCFSDLVFGFGANIVTVVIVAAAIGVAKRSTRNGGRVPFVEKVLLHLLPALGASITFFDMVVLVKKTLDGSYVPYHEWLFKCSQFSVWAIILLASKCGYGYIICCNPILCVWWIIKLCLLVPQLQRDFSSLQVLICLKESFTALVDIMFGILINFIRTTPGPQRSSCMEESLLPCKMEADQGCSRGVVLVKGNDM